MPNWLRTLSDDELRRELENVVYKHTIGFFEEAEHRKLLRGNGHHMAQELVRAAVDLWEERKEVS